MLGAIAGDIIGSIYEAAPIKTTAFPLFGAGATFTDDTVCTVAIADALLQGRPFAEMLRASVRRYPDRGYGAATRAAAIGHLASDGARLLDLATAVRRSRRSSG